MSETELIISVSQARKLLGQDADDMTEAEIVDLIHTLDSMADNALRLAQVRRREIDASDLAQLINDIYQDKKIPS